MQVFTQRTKGHDIAGYPPWLSGLLHARGISTPLQAEAFLRPRLEALHPPGMLQGVAQAAALITALGARGARAVVYGDYDADGLCASVIAKEALQAAGLKCIIYIPQRHTEGYGINAQAVRQLAAQAELLLTVDCGITAIEEVALAKELGMTVIITDHHQPPEQLPAADAIINPMLGDYPFAALCGAATVWKLSWAVNGWDFALRQLDLAALATIADMVPLLEENRIIAHFGLLSLGNTARIGLRAMMANMGMQFGTAPGAERVSFGIAPRLNAGGRLTTARDALALLETTSQEEAHRITLLLNDLNVRRQTEERRVLAQAEAMLADMNLLHTRVIVLHQQGWNSGVVGLAAGRLAEKYGYPTVVLSEEDGQCTGSARSAGGIDLYGALEECKDLFIRFGGHKQAAGLSIVTQNIPSFRERFARAVLNQLGGMPLMMQVPYDAKLNVSDITLQAVRQLEQLAPFGMGNPTPAFLLEDVRVASARAIGAQGQHMKLALAGEGMPLDSVAFGMGDRLKGLPPTLDAVVRLSENAYQGRVSPQAQMVAFKAGTDAFREDNMAQQRALLEDLLAIATNNNMLPPRVLPLDEKFPVEGTLLLCRSLATAQRMHAFCPDFHCASFTHRDPKAGSAVVYAAPLADISGPYELVVFCDGVIGEEEMAYCKELFPQAELMAFPSGAALETLLATIRPDVEELRDAYRHLRMGGQLLDMPWQPMKSRAAGFILAQMELITLDGMNAALLPSKKSDPQHSALYQLLHRRPLGSQ